MRALCVDDERFILENLVECVRTSPDISQVVSFQKGSEALLWARSNLVDIAFLDINLGSMSGLDLASELKILHPNVKIIMCTGYREYAVEAFRIHVSGYLTKPIHPEDIQRELDYLLKRDMKSADRRLKVICFGDFSAEVEGVKLQVRRRKTWELLAYLVDRKGASVTSQKLCAVLWEDDGDRLNYLHQLMGDLRNALKAVGMEGVLQSTYNSHQLDITKLDCDYYHYLEGQTELFCGEYLSNYSWAEVTYAFLMSEYKNRMREKNNRIQI